MSDHDNKCEFQPSQFMNEESCQCYERFLESRVEELEKVIADLPCDSPVCGMDEWTICRNCTTRERIFKEQTK